MNRQNSGRCAVLGLVAAIGCNSALAATVTTVMGSPSIADGVTGISIGTESYNASFRFNGPSHMDLAGSLVGFSEAEATSVMNQIGSALGAAGITSLRYDSVSSPGSTFDSSNATLWYAENGVNLLGKNINAISLNWAFVGNSNAPLNSSKPFFVELTAVPLPAAAWLFGSALLGLIGIGRRKVTD